MIAGLTTGMVIMVLECYSGQAKVLPYLDSYGKHSPGKELLYPEQLENLLVHKEAIIANLKMDIMNLEMKLHSNQSKLA